MSVARPQPGEQFQVNEIGSLRQTLPSVAQDEAGDFVVVWQTESSEIVARKFERDGTPLTPDLVVASTPDDVVTHSAVAVTAAGDFVVAWRYRELDPEADGIGLRRYDTSGAPLGAAFAVPSATGGYRSPPQIAMADDGRFVVVWQGSPGGGSTLQEIRGHLFDARGEPQGSELVVNTTTTGYHLRPAVAMADDGRFVVAWENDPLTLPTPPEIAIRARRFDALGNPSGDDFRVTQEATGYRRQASVATLPGGAFVVTWWVTAYGAGVWGRLFDADGLPAGDELQVNSGTTPTTNPSVAGSADSFVATWARGGADSEITGRRFDAAGAPLGDDFRIDTYEAASDQGFAAVAGSPGGDFVVVWQSTGSPGDDDSYQSVQGRAWVAPPIFADGFESGDTAAWSQAVP